jgi:type IV pilus assembly protein PilC
MPRHPWRRPVSDMELLTLTRHLGAMVGAGIPIIAALKVGADRCSNRDLSDAIITARDRVMSGASISSSMRQSPHIFDPLYCALVEAGESAGILEESLHSLAKDLSARLTLRRHLIAAAIYPIIVLCALAVITAFLLLWVVPTFEELFADSGAQLPWLTRTVVSLSHGLSLFGLPLILLGMLGIISTMRLLRRNRRLARGASRIALRMPVLGSILSLKSSARFCATLGSLIQSGIPILDALFTTSLVIGNAAIAQDIERVRSDIANGSSLSQALTGSSTICVDLIHYIAVGEQSGRLELMLLRCSEHLESDLSDLVNRFQQMLEPALILVIGVIVGTLVLAMYLPIFQMGGLVGQ